MPNITVAMISEKTAAIQATIDALRQQMETMPDGNEKFVAQMKVGSAEILLKKITDHQTTGAEFATHLARMHYLSRAERGEMSLEEAVEKATVLAGKKQFRELFCNENSLDAQMKALESMFDGNRVDHLAKWVSDIDNNVKRDYGKEFETVCKDLKDSARQAAKLRYTQLGAVNEAIRGLDYNRAYTPEQLYAILTDPKLTEEHEAKVKAAESIEKAAATELALSKGSPTHPYPVDPPAYLARSFFYFLDRSGTEEAAEKNQQVLNRMHSDLPEDREFQREYAVNMINQMLAVPDEALCPKNVEEASASLQQYYFEMKVLMEAPNFTSHLVKAYGVPENVVEALLHKGDLYMQNVAPYQDKILTENTSAYRELEMLKGMDADEVSYVASHVRGLPAEKVTSLLTSIGSVVDMKEYGIVVADAAKFDGVKLTKDDLIPTVQARKAQPIKPQERTLRTELKAPTEPEKPGRWATFWHRFGFYEKEFTDYAREMEKFERDTAQYQAKLIERDQQRAESEKWREQNANRVFNELENVGPFKDLAAQVCPQYGDTLDAAFGEIEKKTGNIISRLDYVMVGCRTLRAVLEEEYLNKHPKCDEIISTGGKLNDYFAESLKNGHVNEILLAAALQNCPVRYFPIDPDSGELKVGDNGKIEERSMAVPAAMQGLDGSERARLAQKSAQAVNVSLKDPENGNERMNLAQNCRAAIRQLNFWHCVEIGQADCKYVNDSFISDWEKQTGQSHKGMVNVNGLHISRSVLHSLTETYLLCEMNMTPEQVYDSSYKPLIKQSAGKLIAEMATDPENDCEYLGSLALRGMQEMMKIIDVRVGHRDMMNDASLYSPEMKVVFQMASTAFDLHQEMTVNDKMKAATRPEWAKQHDMEMSTPEQQALITEQTEEFYDKIRSMACVTNLIQEGRTAGCNFCTGAVMHAGQNAGRIVNGEAVRKLLSDRLQSGKNFSDCFTFDETKYAIRAMGVDAIRRELPNAKNQEAFREKCRIYSAEDGVEFATYALSGKMMRECTISFNSDPEAEETTLFSYEPEKVAEEQAETYLSLDGQNLQAEQEQANVEL